MYDPLLDLCQIWAVSRPAQGPSAFPSLIWSGKCICSMTRGIRGDVRDVSVTQALWQNRKKTTIKALYSLHEPCNNEQWETLLLPWDPFTLTWEKVHILRNREVTFYKVTLKQKSNIIFNFKYVKADEILPYWALVTESLSAWAHDLFKQCCDYPSAQGSLTEV